MAGAVGRAAGVRRARGELVRAHVARRTARDVRDAASVARARAAPPGERAAPGAPGTRLLARGEAGRRRVRRGVPRDVRAPAARPALARRALRVAPGGREGDREEPRAVQRRALGAHPRGVHPAVRRRAREPRHAVHGARDGALPVHADGALRRRDAQHRAECEGRPRRAARRALHDTPLPRHRVSPLQRCSGRGDSQQIGYNSLLLPNTGSIPPS